MTIEEFKEILYGRNIPYLMAGSRVICDPPVMDTDIDIVILSDGGFDPERYGFKMTNDSDKYEETDFHTYRNGDINLIHVRTIEQFTAWEWATRAAKAMNLRSKQTRIAFFQGVLYGNWVKS